MAVTGTLTVTFQDEKGRKATASVNVPSTQNPADAGFLTNVADVVGAMHDLTDCRIVGIQLSVPIALPVGLRTSPVAGSDVEEKAAFRYASADPFYSGFEIPGYNESANLPNSAQLDPANEDVDTLNATIIAGPFRTTHGEDLTEAIEAYQTFSNRGKQR